MESQTRQVEDGPPTPCGEPHPRYAGVMCVRYGRCWGGSPHMGILTNPRRAPDEQRKFVYWGGASMEGDEARLNAREDG